MSRQGSRRSPWKRGAHTLGSLCLCTAMVTEPLGWAETAECKSLNPHPRGTHSPPCFPPALPGWKRLPGSSGAAAEPRLLQQQLQQGRAGVWHSQGLYPVCESIIPRQGVPSSAQGVRKEGASRAAPCTLNVFNTASRTNHHQPRVFLSLRAAEQLLCSL